MARVDGYWKIWDVVARGVSYVRTYREDFGVVIASDGLDHLNTFLRTPK
jgi:ABC-type transporter MlaC component